MATTFQSKAQMKQSKKYSYQRGSTFVSILVVTGLLGLTTGGVMLATGDTVLNTAKEGNESMHASHLGTRRGTSPGGDEGIGDDECVDFDCSNDPDNLYVTVNPEEVPGTPGGGGNDCFDFDCSNDPDNHFVTVNAEAPEPPSLFDRARAAGLSAQNARQVVGFSPSGSPEYSCGIVSAPECRSSTPPSMTFSDFQEEEERGRQLVRDTNQRRDDENAAAEVWLEEHAAAAALAAENFVGPPEPPHTWVPSDGAQAEAYDAAWYENTWVGAVANFGMVDLYFKYQHYLPVPSNALARAVDSLSQGRRDEIDALRTLATTLTDRNTPQDESSGDRAIRQELLAHTEDRLREIGARGQSNTEQMQGIGNRLSNAHDPDSLPGKLVFVADVIGGVKGAATYLARRGVKAGTTVFKPGAFSTAYLQGDTVVKNVKEVVGNKGSNQWRLSDADRAETANITADIQNQLRSSGMDKVPEVKVSGPGEMRVAYSDGLQDADLATREARENARVQRNQMFKDAQKELGLETRYPSMTSEQGWTVQVDDNVDNFRHDKDGNVTSWFDPVMVMPPESRRIPVPSTKDPFTGASAGEVFPILNRWFTVRVPHEPT